MSEWERLRQVWAALGCEQNPNDFHAEVRERMWEQAIKMIEASTAGDTRVYRENQQLEAEIRRLREKYEPSERSRCGEPHPHYSSMSCGREPGHDDAHSYGVPRTQPNDPSFCPPLAPGEDETCTHTPTCPAQPDGSQP